MTDQIVRKFLVVVDDTPEAEIALYYAARRARATGGQLTILRVIEPGDFQHWASIEEVMRQEAFDDAENLMKGLAAQVQQNAGLFPEIVVREGKTKTEILKLLADDPSIRILVLGAGSGKDGPGPLVSSLAGQMQSDFKIPITVVPGTLSYDELDALS